MALEQLSTLILRRHGSTKTRDASTNVGEKGGGRNRQRRAREWIRKHKRLTGSEEDLKPQFVKQKTVQE